MRISSLAALLILPLFGNSCMPTAYKSTLDPLALQALQTQDFETSKKIAFAATVSVFQDLGYILEDADLATGFITASGATQSRSDKWKDGSHQITPKATAFLEGIRPRFTTIRLNFTETRIFRDGHTVRETATPNEDPAFYDDMFTKIGEAIFIRSASE